MEIVNKSIHFWFLAAATWFSECSTLYTWYALSSLLVFPIHKFGPFSRYYLDNFELLWDSNDLYEIA